MMQSFKKLYKETGRCPYHPQMMLKVILYAYMNNIYSNRVKEEINNVFTQVVLIFADKGFVSIEVEYIDCTKLESKANKYTFVWRKTVERNQSKLMDKIRVLLEQVDESIAQENSAKDISVEFKPAMLSEIVDDLKEDLDHEPQASDKE